MKKTLITLAALAMASVAGAYTLDGGSVDYGMIVPVGGDFYAGDYTFSFMIHDLADVSAEGTTLASYSGSDATNTYGQNWYTLTNTNDVITLTVGRGNGTTYTDSKTFTTALTVDTAYLISVVGANQSQTATLNAWDGSAYVSVETVESYAGNMNGSTSDYMQSTFNSTFTIPEPTTATLSLLALAGLAARRRRK